MKDPRESIIAITVWTLTVFILGGCVFNHFLPNTIEKEKIVNMPYCVDCYITDKMSLHANKCNEQGGEYMANSRPGNKLWEQCLINKNIDL